MRWTERSGIIVQLLIEGRTAAESRDSMKYSEWNIPCCGAEVPEALVGAGYSPLISALLKKRGIGTPEEANAFLRGGAELLGDPMLLEDMDKAAARLRLAIERRETVTVFGDYDVDGITSACLVTSWLRSKGIECSPYIPDRMEEGYGLNLSAMDTIKARGATLIVTVDCGITAAEEARYAASLGMDMIVTDHHECGACPLPEAVAVVDPKRPGSRYPNSGLAGVGVAFKLLCAVEGSAEGILAEYADLIATGTIADVMPLTGENRYIVKLGLEQLNRPKRPGIRALLAEAGAAGKKISASTVGFTLAPRLNAAGRLGHADVAVRLLLTRDEREAAELAAELCRLNRERQELEHGIFEDARGLLSGEAPTAPIVLAAEGWHQGVIGIAASKLAEEFSLPAIMICLDGDSGKGSCRSFGGFNLFDALSACSDWLEGFGGHALAAGLSIRRDCVEGFRAALAEYYRKLPAAEAPKLVCDLRIDDPALLTMECVESLDELEPFGSGNPRPTLCITDALLDRVTPIGGGRHLKLRLEKGGLLFDCVMFAMREEELGLREGDRVDAAFYPQINEYHGHRSVQLVMLALRRADTLPLCLDILDGRIPGPWDGSDLCPERSDFVKVWRWLERRGGGAHGSLDDISGWRPGGMHPAKLLLCLRVMRDAGLVTAHRSGAEIRVQMQKTEGKADLASHPLMIKLRQFRERYGRR